MDSIPNHALFPLPKSQSEQNLVEYRYGSNCFQNQNKMGTLSLILSFFVFWVKVQILTNCFYLEFGEVVISEMLISYLEPI